MAEEKTIADGERPDNEELAQRIQGGDREAAALLLQQNEGYLTELALRFGSQCEPDDLKQEGALALMEAVGRFDPSRGTKLLTYATPAIETALADYAAMASLPLSIPATRYGQLRRVAYLCATAEDDTEETFLSRIQEEMEVSKKVAKELLAEYRTLFGYQLLGDRVFDIRGGGDPAKAYDRYMRRVLLLKLIEELMAPRELNLVKSYLGIGMPRGEGMTFQELAVRLNYNDPSGAEKAYKKAIKKIQDNLDSGEYGRWVEIQRMLRLAQRHGPVGELK